MNRQLKKQKRIPKDILKAATEIWRIGDKRHFISVKGCSMFPFIREHDKILVCYGSEKIRRGDVIVFSCGDMLVTHRVTHIYGNKANPTFLTKGDNSWRFDTPLKADEILGRVLAIERNGQHIPLNTFKFRIAGWFIAISAHIRKRSASGGGC